MTVRIYKSFIPLFLFAVTFTVAGYFSRIGVDAHHDGIMFKPAFDVARGSMLFRDTFTQYGALTTLLQAGALMLFGKYLLTIQVFTAFFYGLIASLLYSIYQRILPKSLSVITVFLWIFMSPYFLVPFLPWASVYALFFQLLGTYLLIRYEEHVNNSYLFGAGAATAATFLTRQPGGVFMLCAVYAYFFCTFITKNISFRQLIRVLYLYTCGVVLIMSCFLIWIATNGAFGDFWLQSVRLAYITGTGRTNYTILGIIATLFPGGHPISLWELFPTATIFLSIVFVIALKQKQNIKQAKTVLITAAIGLSAWTQYYPLNDDRHVFWGSTQMFGLLTLAFFTVCGYIFRISFRKHHRKLIVGCTCVILAYFFGPLIVLRFTTGIERIRQPYVRVYKPDILRGMLVTADEAYYYSFVYNTIETYFQNNPGGNVINLSAESLYGTFDPRIKNIHPVNIVWFWLYDSYPDHFINQIPSYIRQNKPLVTTNVLDYIPDGYCPLVTPPNAYSIVLSLPCK